MTRIILLISCIFISFSLMSQQRFLVDVSERSEVSVRGSSNVVSFHLKQSLVQFFGKKQQISIRQNGRNFTLNENVINIPVKGFDSDNKMALRDFKKLVLAPKYPDIVLVIKQFSLPDNIVKHTKTHIQIPVEITITNQSKPYLITLESFLSGNSLHLKAAKNINIKDFGLEPPVSMMGLIKVSEWIEIQINTELKISKI